jgi:hypothetical protein
MTLALIAVAVNGWRNWKTTDPVREDQEVG